MSTSTHDTFSLDEAEVTRFRAMASAAEENESELWQQAGIRAGGHVVDLGCGPGVLLPLLAQRVGSTGTVIGVDVDPPAWAAADLLVHRGFASRSEVARWRRALAARQERGPLHCILTTTAVLATPRTAQDQR